MKINGEKNQGSINTNFLLKNSKLSINIQNNNCIINTTNSNNINIAEKENKILYKKDMLSQYTIKYNDNEINYLLYEDALKLEKRTYIQYYFSLIKTKHLIVFTFYTSNDYNSKAIKIILFLFSFSLYLTINALFFNDKTMHIIYEDQE